MRSLYHIKEVSSKFKFVNRPQRNSKLKINPVKKDTKAKLLKKRFKPKIIKKVKRPQNHPKSPLCAASWYPGDSSLQERRKPDKGPGIIRRKSGVDKEEK